MVGVCNTSVIIISYNKKKRKNRKRKKIPRTRDICVSSPITSPIYRTRSFMEQALPEGLLTLNAPANTEFYF